MSGRTTGPVQAGARRRSPQLRGDRMRTRATADVVRREPPERSPARGIGSAALGGYNGLAAPALTLPRAPMGLGILPMFRLVAVVTALVFVGLGD